MGHWLKHNTDRTRQAVFGCIVLALFVLIGGIVLTASVPPVSRDALTHHLALPKLYLQHGGLVELPNIPFSYYPMNLDLLYLAALAFGNDILPKYIHLLFALFTAGLMYHYLRGRMNVTFGLLGALLWLSTPIVVRLASEVYVDLGVTFFGFASIYMLIRWIDSKFRMRYLIWSGIWCGLSLGTKYNALLILAILSLMVPFIRSRMGFVKPQHYRQTINSISGNETGRRKGATGGGRTVPVLISAICFIGISLAVFSPWMIRNTILKNNPIYPMFNKLFNTEDNPDDEWSRTSTMVQDTSGTMAVRHLVFKESLGYMALMPLRIFYEGRDDSPRHFDGKLNPFLVLFAIVGFFPLAKLPRGMRVEQCIWWWFAILLILMVFFTAPIRIRYLVPALPAIVVLAMIGIYRFWVYADRIGGSGLQFLFKMVLSAAVVMMLGYNTNYFIDRYKNISPWDYISGVTTRDEYISERRPEYSLIKYANKNLPSDSVLLGLFLGQRRYYFEREILFNEGLLLKAVIESNRDDDISKYLHKKGITHVMLRVDLFLDWVSRNISPSDINKLQSFLDNNLRKVKEISGFTLYALQG